MPSFNPYLNFFGKCTEAMRFYKEVFDGELFIQTVGDSPAKDEIREELHNYVFHSHLKATGFEMMASDMALTQPIEGNTVYMALVFKDAEELLIIFDKLSEDSKMAQPLQKTSFGCFASLQDKFGKHWMLRCNTK